MSAADSCPRCGGVMRPRARLCYACATESARALVGKYGIDERDVLVVADALTWPPSFVAKWSAAGRRK